jgi:hypothetical protein
VGVQRRPGASRALAASALLHRCRPAPDQYRGNPPVDALIIAAGIELDDHLRFDHHDTSEEQTAGRPTRKVRFNAMFGLTRLKVVSVDVVVTTALPRGDVTVEALTAPFKVDSRPWSDVRMWPLEDHIADKIAAVYERRGPDRKHSSRVKDLVDLVLIALKSTVSGPLTHSALHAEVRRRQDFGTHLVLPSVFDVPDRTSWTSAITSKLPEPGIFRSSTEPSTAS